MNRTLIESICEHCGKPFSHRKRTSIYQARYCSRACVSRARSERIKVKLSCIICGQIFFIRPCAHHRKTCSYECKRIYLKQIYTSQEMKEMAKVRGIKVSKSMLGKPNLKRRKPLIEKSCLFCGKTFQISNKNGNHRKEIRRFCSTDCWYEYIREDQLRHPGWRGGYEPYYGPNWNIQRNKARQRDNYLCQDCGVSEPVIGQELDVHHINPFRLFGIKHYQKANKINNLITLCKSCHAKR